LCPKLRSSNSIQGLILCLGTLHPLPLPHVDSLVSQATLFHSSIGYLPLSHSVHYSLHFAMLFCQGCSPMGATGLSVLNTPRTHMTLPVWLYLAYRPQMRPLAPTQSIRGTRLVTFSVPTPFKTLASLDKRQLSAAIQTAFSMLLDRLMVFRSFLRRLEAAPIYSFEVMDQNTGRTDRHLMGPTAVAISSVMTINV
jgi:hypothetical protein